jgi:hypothetical protein
MTFPFGYNPGNVLKRGVVAKVANEETYPLGIMTLASPSGNSLKVYYQYREELPNFPQKLVK